MQSPDFVHKKFELEDYPDEYFELCQQILGYYHEIDSIELWNIESINSTIRQIEYYHDSNIFSNTEDSLYVIV